MKLEPRLEEKIERFGSESRILETAVGELSEAQIVRKIGKRVMADFNPNRGRNEIAIITNDKGLHRGIINYIAKEVKQRGERYEQIFVAGYCPTTSFMPVPEDLPKIYRVEVDNMMTYRSLMSN